MVIDDSYYLEKKLIVLYPILVKVSMSLSTNDFLSSDYYKLLNLIKLNSQNPNPINRNVMDIILTAYSKVKSFPENMIPGVYDKTGINLD